MYAFYSFFLLYCGGQNIQYYVKSRMVRLDFMLIIRTEVQYFIKDDTSCG